LQYPRERIALVVNRPLGRADLREGDISRTLDMPISAVIPLDKEIATAVNRGVPVTVSASRAPAAKAMRELAEHLLPQAGGSESKSAGGEAKVQKRAASPSAPKVPSAGRQSVLKAGMSRFSKSKDKKAA